MPTLRRLAVRVLVAIIRATGPKTTQPLVVFEGLPEFELDDRDAELADAFERAFGAESWRDKVAA